MKTTNASVQKTKLILDKAFVISEIDDRIYGSFIEHLGRAVYGGIYDPENPNSDENGFRKDVLERIKNINVPIVRYPGGNFVSGFNWEDSIGPKAQRPKRLDLAWFTTETNQFGLHEFYDWSQKAQTEIMYAINLGTRGIDAARNIVEYTNHPSGTYWSDLRIKNGAKDPFAIKTWCLGNEMDGPWQIGQKTAYEYGRIANEAAKVMKWVDASIELVACGSSAYDMPTFGDWELDMLEQCYDNIDYLSLHRYYTNHEDDTQNFVAKNIDLDAFIQTVVSIADTVGGKKRSKKKINLSFDEWNVWYHSNQQDQEITEKHRWGNSLPLLEDIYNFEDALLVGGMLNTLVRNSDRVKMACLAQLVNAIAPIMTSKNGCWPQTTYWPYLYVSKYGRGKALQPIVEAPFHSTKEFDDVPMIDVSAVLNKDGMLSVFILNRSQTDAANVECDFRGFGDYHFSEHILLHHKDNKAINTEEAPNTVSPITNTTSQTENGITIVQVPAFSWNVIRFSTKDRSNK